MYAITLHDDASDPFKDVLSKLNDIAANAGSLSAPLAALNDPLSSVVQITQDVNSMYTMLGEAQDAMRGLMDVCVALTEIPVVGEIADMAADVLSGVQHTANTLQDALSPINDAANEVRAALGKVQNGIQELAQVTGTMSTDIPNFTNTLSILDCLMEIATPLVGMLQGTEASGKLQTLTSQYASIRDTVSQDVDPVVSGIDTLSKDLVTFLSTLQGIVSTVRSDLSAAMSSLGSVDSVLNPIRSAMHAVEDAIAPVRWALDAISCIVDKVFKPVINAVLDATGLSGLVHSLEQDLANALGVQGVIDKLTSSLGMNSVTDMVGQLDVTASGGSGASILNGWQTLSSTLGSYSQNNNQGNKQAVSDLVAAITNTPIDPTKPSVVPPWPTPPVIHIPGAPMLQGRRPLPDLSVLLRLQPAGRAMPMLVAVNVGAAAAPADNQQQLNAAIQKLSTTLTSMQADAAQMEAGLQAFSASLSIPATFATQTSLLGQVLSTVSDFLGVVGQIPLFETAFTQEVGQFVAGQQACITTINTGLAGLGTAVQAVQAQVGPVINHVPSTTVISQAVSKLAGWASGANTLMTTLAAAPPNASAVQQQQLQAFHDTVTGTSFPQVVQTIADMQTLADTINASISGVITQLKVFAQALASVTAHDQLISAHAIPTFTTVAANLKTIDSIFDPLSQLLQLMGCTDKTKAGYAKVVAGVRDSSIVTASTIAKKAAAFITAALPLNQLASDIQSAQTTLQTTVLQGLTQNCGQLTAALDALTAKLEAQYTCSFAGANSKPVDASNQFVNADHVASARALVVSFAA